MVGLEVWGSKLLGITLVESGASGMFSALEKVGDIECGVDVKGRGIVSPRKVPIS